MVPCTCYVTFECYFMFTWYEYGCNIMITTGHKRKSIINNFMLIANMIKVFIYKQKKCLKLVTIILIQYIAQFSSLENIRWVIVLIVFYISLTYNMHTILNLTSPAYWETKQHFTLRHITTTRIDFIALHATWWQQCYDQKRQKINFTGFFFVFKEREK